MKKSILVLVLLALGACASKPPEPIARVPQDNPSLMRVRLDIDSYIGRDVRWGGIIASVENRADTTWVEIVRHDLRSNGRPRSGGKSDGRFIASFGNFLDPVVYEVGRPLTVVGKISGKNSRKIGDYDYLYAIVDVEGSYLWKNAPDVIYVHDHYYWWHYDPWYRHHGWHHRHY